MTARTTPRQHWRAGWTAMLIAALCRGVLAMLASLLVWSLLPVALGWHVTVVMSGSMEPALRPGDVVASRQVAAQQVRAGQVLLVDDPDHAGRLRLHRLVKSHANGTLTLRGDANSADDSTPVRRNAVRGVGSLRVPFVGTPAYWLRTHQPTPLAGTVAALVLLLAGACARRDEDDEEPSEDTDDGSTTGARPDSPELHEDETNVRKAAFIARPGPLAAVGLITLGLVATGAPALATPFAGSTSTGSTWTAASSFLTCRQAALADKPYFLYPLDEAAGTTATDASGNGRNGTYSSTGVTHGASGPCPKDRANATTFSGGTVTRSGPVAAAFTSEIWFRTTTTRGGSLIGYSSSGLLTSNEPRIYLNNSGQVVFGIYTNTLLILGSVTTVTSSRTYADGAWHLADATVSSAGMKLYVDGALVASDSSKTSAGNQSGSWQIGNSSFTGWPSPPTSQSISGTLAGAAVYSTALPADRITAHYAAR